MSAEVWDVVQKRATRCSDNAFFNFCLQQNNIQSVRKQVPLTIVRNFTINPWGFCALVSGSGGSARSLGETGSSWRKYASWLCRPFEDFCACQLTQWRCDCSHSFFWSNWNSLLKSDLDLRHGVVDDQLSLGDIIPSSLNVSMFIRVCTVEFTCESNYEISQRMIFDWSWLLRIRLGEQRRINIHVTWGVLTKWENIECCK